MSTLTINELGDIDVFTVIDEEIETIRKRGLDIGEHLDNLSERINRKTERGEDSLFQ